MKEEVFPSNWYIRGVNGESTLFSNYCKSKNFPNYKYAFEPRYVYYVDEGQIIYDTSPPLDYVEINIHQFKTHVYNEPSISNEDDMTYLKKFLLKLNIK